MRRVGLALLLTGCQPGDGLSDRPDCATEAPETGEIRVGAVQCGDQLFGEGRTSDYLMANSRIRAIVRNPEHALTLIGVGGGTISELAPWGYQSRVHEVVPTIRGGWLDVDRFEQLEDGYRVRGTVRSLPDAAGPEGATAEVTYRIAPDTDWIDIEGADGLWLHPLGDYTVWRDTIVFDGALYVHNGTVQQDLGGALRISGATRIRAGTTLDWSVAGNQRVSGEAPEAGRVALFSEGTRIGHIPLPESGAFDQRVPAAVDALRAEATGRAPGPLVPAGRNLTLEVGRAGSLELRFAWTSSPRPVEVAWRNQTGDSGAILVAPEGGQLDLGLGTYDLTLGAGPTVATAQYRVTLSDEQLTVLRVAMAPAIEPGKWMSFGSAPTSASRTWRGSNVTALYGAAGDGFEQVVLYAEDDVPVVESRSELRPWTRHQTGVLTTSVDGWEILSFPWSANDKRAGHAAPNARLLAPELAHGVARGGNSTDRWTVVDRTWMEAVSGHPVSISPHPDFVRLEGTDDPLDDWAAWFAWLDAGVPLLPWGDQVWLELEQARLNGPVDIERALQAHKVTAGTGALLDLHVNGFGIGAQVVRRGTRPHRGRGRPVGTRLAQVGLQDPTGTLDQLALVTSEGIVASWPTSSLDGGTAIAIETAPWVVAVAWSTTTEDWAATGPIWMDPPG